MMNRRQFLLTGVAVVATSSIALPLLASRYQGQTAALIGQLRQLQGKPLQSSGSWNVSQIFQHLTQSVQGSYLGYPQLRASWFRHSIGPLALTGFKAAGAMKHPLDEAIPAMPPLDPALPAEQALSQLISALQQFSEASSLSPHFAYGMLNADDYACAHRLHIEAHLAQIQLS